MYGIFSFSFVLLFSFLSFVLSQSPSPAPKTAVYYPTAPLDRDTDLYNFNYPNRGKAIIFNHREFIDSDRYATRNGTMKDAECMETELKKLDFDVNTYIDLTLDEVLDVIDRSKSHHNIVMR